MIDRDRKLLQMLSDRLLGGVTVRASDLRSREVLWNATRHRQSENYGHFRTCKLNSVYFGPQTAKNKTGVLAHPTGGHQAGHCHASGYYY